MTPPDARPVKTGGTLSSVPNTPGTPRRSVRVPDQLWFEALDYARDDGDDLSEIMRDALVRYVKRKRRERNAKP